MPKINASKHVKQCLRKVRNMESCFDTHFSHNCMTRTFRVCNYRYMQNLTFTGFCVKCCIFKFCEISTNIGSNKTVTDVCCRPAATFHSSRMGQAEPRTRASLSISFHPSPMSEQSRRLEGLLNLIVIFLFVYPQLEISPSEVLLKRHFTVCHSKLEEPTG